MPDLLWSRRFANLCSNGGALRLPCYCIRNGKARCRTPAHSTGTPPFLSRAAARPTTCRDPSLVLISHFDASRKATRHRDFGKRSMICSSDTSLFGSGIAARSRWRRACGGSLVVAGFFAIPADAQELPDLQRELREMRQHYDAELRRLRRDYESDRPPRKASEGSRRCRAQGS